MRLETTVAKAAKSNHDDVAGMKALPLCVRRHRGDSVYRDVTRSSITGLPRNRQPRKAWKKVRARGERGGSVRPNGPRTEPPHFSILFSLAKLLLAWEEEKAK